MRLGKAGAWRSESEHETMRSALGPDGFAEAPIGLMRLSRREVEPITNRDGDTVGEVTL